MRWYSTVPHETHSVHHRRWFSFFRFLLPFCPLLALILFIYLFFPLLFYVISLFLKNRSSFSPRYLPTSLLFNNSTPCSLGCCISHTWCILLRNFLVLLFGLERFLFSPTDIIAASAHLLSASYDIPIMPSQAALLIGEITHARAEWESLSSFLVLKVNWPIAYQSYQVRK